MFVWIEARLPMCAVRVLVVTTMLVMLVGQLGWAASPAPGAPAVDELLQQLDSSKFDARRRATDSLFAMGKEAIDKLASAASGESREVTERSIEILRRHYRSQDEETKAAAKQALESLASGPNSRIGRAAKEAMRIEQPQQGPNPAQIARMQRAFPPQIQQRFPIVPPAGGNQQFARRTKVQITNGVKEIEVDYGNKQIKVKETADGKIKATIIETMNGAKVAKTIEAKNADELKQKSPEAHKVYESLGKNAGAGLRIVQNMGGAPKPNLPPGPNNLKQAQNQAYDRMIKSLEAQKEFMKKRFADPQQAEQLKRITDVLDQQIERVRDRQKNLQDAP